MKEFQSKTVMLLVLFIGLAFLAIGLTLAQFFLTGECEYSACTAGLPEFLLP